MAITGLTEKMNALQAQTPGARSALAGLAVIKSPASSPVWVFSPLLDTTGALDLNQLAFDEIAANRRCSDNRRRCIPGPEGPERDLRG